MTNEKVLEYQVGYQLKRVQHALRLEMDEALRELGLTTPQYAALSVLGDEPGLSGAELARRCFVTAQTMNQILTKLESAEFVERRPHPEHGRILGARLTKKGTKRVTRAHGVVEVIEERMLDGLGRKKRARLRDALQSCTEALENGATAKLKS
jgi:DNA-binding MarR family transcriptional regulator